ncbi:MAG TPA: methyltransferase [Gammaproteobacteria bacterium]|jgi:predicted methyltransferase
MRHLALAAIAFTLPAAVLAAAGDSTATPAYITAAMDSPERMADAGDDARRQMAAVMTFTQVKPGQKVAELVPDGGYWTKVFSGIVGPRGHVYTIWPDGYQQYVGESYAQWQKFVTTPQYSNVSLIRGAGGDLKVPGSVDLVFTAQNYHDYHDKFMGPVDMVAFDKKVFDTLKPGGVFVVIDNVAPAGSGFSDTDTTHRVDPEAVKKEVESAGFVFDGASDALKNPADTHTLISYKPPMSGHNDEFIFRFRKPTK